MILHKKHKTTPREQARLTLASEYSRLSERLEQCRASFDMVTEQEVIDALIFEENAILARMAALTKEAKAAGFSAELHELPPRA